MPVRPWCCCACCSVVAILSAAFHACHCHCCCGCLLCPALLISLSFIHCHGHFQKKSSGPRHVGRRQTFLHLTLSICLAPASTTLLLAFFTLSRNDIVLLVVVVVVDYERVVVDTCSKLCGVVQQATALATFDFFIVVLVAPNQRLDRGMK